jgi:hypothetical protein
MVFTVQEHWLLEQACTSGVQACRRAGGLWLTVRLRGCVYSVRRRMYFCTADWRLAVLDFRRYDTEGRQTLAASLYMS